MTSRDIARWGTAVIAALFCIYTAWTLWTATTLSANASLGWRTHLLLVEGGPSLLIACGLVLTLLRHPRLRQLGWCLVACTLLAQLVWTYYAVVPHPVTASNTITASLLNHLRLAPIIISALTTTPPPSPPFDEATRNRLVESAYRRYSNELFHFATYCVKQSAVDTMLAENAVQDTFLAILEHKQDDILHRDDSSLRAHLFSTIRQRVRNTRRADYESIAAEAQQAMDQIPTPAELHGQAELATRIRFALTQCPKRAAEAFTLVRECGLSYAEAAAVMEISVKAISAHLVAATRHILPYIKDWLPPTPKPASPTKEATT
jgi:RNA polymerase sigma-70 factor (ECF subfamily)